MPVKPGLRSAVLASGPNRREGEANFYRGAEEPYRALAAHPGVAGSAALGGPFTTANFMQEPGGRAIVVTPKFVPVLDEVVCRDEKGFRVFKNECFQCGSHVDPFLSTGGCFDLDEGEFVISAQRMALYDLDDVMQKPTVARLFVNAVGLLLQGSVRAQPTLAPLNITQTTQAIAAIDVKINNALTGAGNDDPALLQRLYKEAELQRRIRLHLLLDGNALQRSQTQTTAPDVCDGNAMRGYVQNVLDYFDLMHGAAVNNSVALFQTLRAQMDLEMAELPFARCLAGRRRRSTRTSGPRTVKDALTA